MAPKSIRARLILAAALWLVLGLGAGAWILSHVFADAVENGFRERLAAHLRALTAVVDVGPDGAAVVGKPMGEPRFEQPYSGWYWQVSDGAEVKARSRSLWDFALAVAPAPSPGAVHSSRVEGPRGESLELLERDLIFPDGARPLHLAVAASRAEIDAEEARFTLLLAAASAALGLGLVGAVALQVGFGLKPLRRLAAELEALRLVGGRVGTDYPAEIAPLAEAVNDTLDHDSRLIERARAHVGNLAHGLKTPLAVMGAELASGRPDSTAMADQLERLNQLVDLHLARARAEAVSGSPAWSPLAPVIEDIASALRKIHADKGLTIELRLEDGAGLPANAEDCAEICGNLMDNACKWAKSQILVTAGRGYVRIEDDGPGMSPDQAEMATARGTRLDESAPGSGLGLAIVADLAGMLGLDLRFGVSGLGGLLARVSARPARLKA